ncbi:acyltransferase family protein [uncultured Streptococcus sp.]|uniref:acyltransferase family protein n=1 Tax=uncultured Streptococcus sp. TaxID=83427 RepID=UPI002591797A|nr:acyltransferase family protein [uncultured Streptococcus sp.]
MRIKWFSMVRVTGLLLVLLYHFFKTAFPGGFIGVDIFFTFSGYLITALLIDEYAKNKKIDLLGFYKRRFYRIVPPLVLMILIVMPFTYLVRKDYVASIGSQIAAAVGFTTNFYEIIIGGNYETQFIPHLFVHTWSLAIEMHFYLIWGFLVWFLGKHRDNVAKFRSLIFAVSAAFFAGSFLSMFIQAFFVDNVSTIYFSSLSHSFPFFLGAMVATMTGIRETTTRFKKNVRLWSIKRSILTMVLSFALLLLLTFALKFDQRITYLFGFVLASLFAMVMIYAARVLNDQTPNAKEPAIINYLADVSYGVYLFHWPFYIIFTQVISNGLAVLVTVIFSLIFSTLSYYVLEPFLAGKSVKLLGLNLDLHPYQKWLYGGGALLGLVTIVTIIISPAVGDFETSLLVSSLQQAQTNLNRTHTVTAGDATALSDVTVIGDSVALRSNAAFSSLLPDTQVDAAVSRSFDDAFEIFQNEISSGTLSQTTVLAVGVNSLDNYQEDLQQFIAALPDGYRLIIVTPYNANNEAQVKEVRDYELTLADTYNYVTVADWYKAATKHPEIWSGTDGVHYSDSDTTGADLYVKTIQKAIEKSAKNPAKGESDS